MIKASLRLQMADVKPAAFISICFMLLHGFVATLNCTSPTPESLIGELEKNVFPNNLLRPVKSFSSPINITISITVGAIVGVDEKFQTLTTILWQVLEWDIEGLSWDEEECGTKRVSVPRENLWVPDIHITELVDEDNTPKTPYVYLYNTGHVVDNKQIRAVSSCRLVIYTFPFDIQNCTLTFGSYLHFDTDIRMIPDNASEEILPQNVLETNGEWELTGVSVIPSTLELQEGSYSVIKYYNFLTGKRTVGGALLAMHTMLIVLRRRPLLYVVNLLIPSCFLVTVDLFSFMLPPHSVDRSSFKMTLILGYTVFLLTMNELLPITGETTPLINVFLFISFALMVASLLETVFITNIQYSSSQYSAVPNWLSVLVLRYLAVIVCLPRKAKSNKKTVILNPSATEPAMNSSITSISLNHLQHTSDDTPTDKPPLEPALEELRKLSRDLMAIRLQVDKHFQGSKSLHEWQMVGIVVDRLLFCLYIVFIVFSFLTVICIWIWSNLYTA